MKDLLLTHIDLDGISPIILMNLTNEDFTYKALDISEIDAYFDELLKSDLSNYNNIYVVDLALSDDIYKRINNLNLNIKVFDHHETHLFANCYDYVNVSVDIDGTLTCGTELFYNYLITIYPDLKRRNIKEYVELVRQLDTYTFTDETARDLDNIRASLGRNEFIKTITRRLKKDKEHFEFSTFEKRLLKLKRQEVENYLKRQELKMERYVIDNKLCGVVFSTKFASDLGNYLATKYDDLDLVILIDTSKGISYRATKDDINVAEFAAKYGGGGHKHASGSRFSDEDKDKIVAYYFNYQSKKPRE